MTTNNSTSKQLVVIAISSLFLWACSDTPTPTVSHSSEIQEKLVASDHALKDNDMGTGGMEEMHTAMAQDSLWAEGTMAGAEFDLIHASDMGTGGMEEIHTAMAQDSLHMGGAMMRDKDPGGAMALSWNGTEVGSQEPPPTFQAEAPTSSIQGKAHGH